MIDAAYVQRMARYNRWQNENLYGAATTLSDGQRKLDAGAFFGSIHGTLAHLLWADMTWMHRFHPSLPPAPARPDNASFVTLCPDWNALVRSRAAFDASIIAWADALDPAWLEGDLTWTSSDGSRTRSLAKWILVTHFFNHQTHHRGQVHCLLTAAGAKPGDTDLMILKV